MARALGRLGARVTIVAPPSRGGPSGPRGLDAGATDRGAGILSTQFWDEVLAPYALRSLRIVEYLARAGRVHLGRTGMAQIALSEHEGRHLERLVRLRRALRVPIREGLPAPLRESLDPAFLRRIVSATFGVEDSWVEARPLLRALLREAGPGLRIEAGRAARRLGADLRVIATGASLGIPGGRARESVAWSLRAERAAPVIFHVLDSGLYGRPNGPGAAVVGDGIAPLRGARGHDALFGGAARVVRRWSGRCVMTGDGRPSCGIAPDGRTWLLGALGGDGLAIAPALAEDLAANVLGRRGAPDLSAFALDRFSRRR